MRRGRVVDPVAGLPPMLVYALILLFDLALIAAILVAFVWAGDRVEDMLFPGGPEWVTF